ncbi:hypothetical protein CCHL11_01013 [Colletotrichum chlorophyti]|uniref:Cyanovirin-N domain-containing protein n=1 Tax=Colletotrichum chlorophyti TaxID=708187 RepID=A0A1Q8S7I3_9PEZI|nr:hypothetical protein CCHL11_01013 [Colletotrichum chlorophyti]
MNFLSCVLAFLSLLAAFASAQQKCPTESDCMQKSCTNFRLKWYSLSLYDFKEYETSEWRFRDRTRLYADCKDNAGVLTTTWVDLHHCIRNVHGEIFWQNKLSSLSKLPLCPASCKCHLKERKSDSDAVIMRCDCYARKGKMVTSDFDLSYGIWTYDGAIGCYQNPTNKFPRPRKRDVIAGSTFNANKPEVAVPGSIISKREETGRANEATLEKREEGAQECPTESDCFYKSCTNIKLNKDYKPPIDMFKSVISAECKDSEGRVINTWLDLKRCIANEAGKLAEGSVSLSCKCKIGNAKAVRKTIDLSSNIWVKNGGIGCYKHEGQKSLAYPVHDGLKA